MTFLPGLRETRPVLSDEFWRPELYIDTERQGIDWPRLAEGILGAC